MMDFKSNLAVLTIITALFLNQSCSKDDSLQESPAMNISAEQTGEMVKLGKQLENPYSVENMQKAYNNLLQSGVNLKSDIVIETTHLYVRFLPADTAEVAMLNADTTLELFDHPLDFEIEQVGNWYHDPSIPDNLPTWQYTVVEPDFNFPNMQQSILPYKIKMTQTTHGYRLMLAILLYMEA